MTPRLSPGDRIPQVVLGRLVNAAVEHVSLQELLGARRAVLVGIPGAFTPVCTREHIPDSFSTPIACAPAAWTS